MTEHLPESFRISLDKQRTVKHESEELAKSAEWAKNEYHRNYEDLIIAAEFIGPLAARCIESYDTLSHVTYTNHPRLLRRPVTTVERTMIGSGWTIASYNEYHYEEPSYSNAGNNIDSHTIHGVLLSTDGTLFAYGLNVGVRNGEKLPVTSGKPNGAIEVQNQQIFDEMGYPEILMRKPIVTFDRVQNGLAAFVAEHELTID